MSASDTTARHSDYIVFVDESGDHGIAKIDPGYPVFVLLFCILKKEDYINVISPTLQRLKFEFFGKDTVILHEYDIRKAYKEFSILQNPEIRARFMNAISDAISAAPMTLIGTVVDKLKLTNKYVYPANPYNLAMQFGLERVHRFLKQNGQGERQTFLICEARGKREDSELELEFRRVCDGANYRSENFPFKIEFVSKLSNSAGLQIADLAARPIGRFVLTPTQPNRAYKTIETKLFRSSVGRLDGWGLKCFP